ncbi:MAG: hypothetical protein D6797_00800 [Bdellovibrio sp.]|nr:MAG: hypothetical protein D6797_00800 [Bdellovibrio sp.]
MASLGLGGSIACIGSRDYTGALSQISTLVSQIINNSFTYANLGPNEVIVGIQVTDSSGHTRTYNGTGGIISINGNTIQVNPGYTILHTGDQVKIMIETRYASRRTFF